MAEVSQLKYETNVIKIKSIMTKFIKNVILVSWSISNDGISNS